MTASAFLAKSSPSTNGWSRAGAVLGTTAVALGAAALYNSYHTRQIERRHPPAGRFVEVDGVRLHYLEQGTGTPVVLLHGNVVTAEDWILSGVLDQVAARGHRVIAFDRPGYGYSDRPRHTAWTATAQANLIRRAVARLGVERDAVVIGHSWERWPPWRSRLPIQRRCAAWSWCRAIITRPCGPMRCWSHPQPCPFSAMCCVTRSRRCSVRHPCRCCSRECSRLCRCRNAFSRASSAAWRCGHCRSEPRPRMAPAWLIAA